LTSCGHDGHSPLSVYENQGSLVYEQLGQKIFSKILSTGLKKQTFKRATAGVGYKTYPYSDVPYSDVQMFNVTFNSK